MLRAYLTLIPVLLILTGCAAPTTATPRPQKIAEAARAITAPSATLGPPVPPLGPPAPTPTPYAPPSGFERIPVRQVCVLVAANLRAGPGVNYPKVGSVQPGALLKIDGYSIASDGMWFHIVSGEWIRSDLVGDCLPTPTPTDVPPCLIKGNISFNTGEKIYHLPNCPDYDKTVIDERYGERWFCTEDGARENGWRKARNCP